MADNPLLNDITVYDTVVTIGSEIEKRLQHVQDRYDEFPNNDPAAFIKNLDITPFRISMNVTAIETPSITACIISGPSSFTLTSTAFLPTELPHTASDWEVSLNADMSNPVAQLTASTLLTSAPLNVGNIGYDTDYYFRVRYHSNGFVSHWSNPFKVTTAPPAAITPPTITTYNKVTDADSFNLVASAFQHAVLSHSRSVWEVSLQSDFGVVLSTVDTTQNLTSCIFPVANVQEDTNYYFRVKYYSGKYSSAWSPIVVVKTPISSFINTPSILIEPPLCPYNFALAASQFDPSSPTLLHTRTVWQVATDGAFTNIIANIQTTEDLTSILIPENTCNTATEYFVRVRYESNEIVSQWSPIINTTTGYVVNARPKREDLVPFSNEIGISEVFEPVKIGTELYGVYETKSGNYGFAKFDFNTKAFSSIIETSTPFEYEHKFCSAGTKIVLLGGSDVSVIKVDVFDTASNSLTTLTTFDKKTPDSDGMKTSFASGCGVTYFNDVLYIVSDGVFFTLNLNTGIKTPIITTGKTEGVDLPTDFSTTAFCLLEVCEDHLIYMTAVSSNLQVWRYNPNNNSWVGKNALSSLPFSADPSYDSYGYQLIKVDTGLILVGCAELKNSKTLYWFKSHDATTDTWTDLEVPAIRDFEYPFFEAVGSNIYVISIAYNDIMYAPELASVSLSIAVSSLIGNWYGSDVISSDLAFVHDSKLCYISYSEYHPQRGYGYYFSVTMVDPIAKTQTVKHIIIPEGFPRPTTYGTTTIYGNGKLYFCGGYYDDAYEEDWSTSIKRIWEWDIETGEMIIFDTNGTYLFDAASCFYDNKLFFSGGKFSTDSTDYAHPRYLDLTTKTWVTLDQSFGTERDKAKLRVVNGNLIMFGGTSTVLTAEQLKLGKKWIVGTGLTNLPEKKPSPNAFEFVFNNAFYTMAPTVVVGTDTSFTLYKLNETTDTFDEFAVIPFPSIDYSGNLTWLAGFDLLGELYLYSSISRPYDQIKKIADNILFKVDLQTLTCTVILNGVTCHKLLLSSSFPMTGSGNVEGLSVEVIGKLEGSNGTWEDWAVLPPVKITTPLQQDVLMSSQIFDIDKLFNLANNFTGTGNFKLRFRTSKTAWSDWSNEKSFTKIPPP